MGLGLAIAAKIGGVHGGTIHAESDPNRGTTMTVRLALAAVIRPAAPRRLALRTPLVTDHREPRRPA